MKNVNKKVAAGYGRVSTDDQAKNGLSIDVQEQVCRKAMMDDGYEVLEFIKDEGKSGGTLNRAGIKEIIRLVDEQKIEAIYTVHSDRIARNTLDYLQLRQLFREKGVTLKCLYQPMTDDSATSRTMDTVVASFNEMQRLVTSEKVKATLYDKAKQGYFPTTPPPGYKNMDNPDKSVDRSAKKIVVKDLDTAPIVKEIFQLCSTGNFNGYDLSDIAFEKGLKSQRGGKMSRSRVYDLLKNRFYLGEVHWGPIHNKNGRHEALIEEPLFNRVQEVLDMHNNHACRRRKYNWLLHGFLYCFKHARRYTAEWHKIKSKDRERIAYYHCSHPGGCGKYIEQVELESKVAEKFQDLEFHPDFVNLVIEKAKKIFFEKRRDYDRRRQFLVNQRTPLENRKKVTQDKLFDGVITDEEFTQSRNQLNEEIHRVDQQLHELERNKEIQVDIAQEILLFTRDIYKAYQKASPVLKRHYLAFFWQKFEMQDGVIINSHPSLLFEELSKLQQIYYRSKDSEKPIESNVPSSVIIKIPLLLG